MRKILLLFTVITFSYQSFAQLRVMTYNIRYDNKDDGINQWSNRKQNVIAIVKKYNPDIVGVQEALVNQMAYLDSMLPGFDHTGVGRDDGKTAGEYSAVFYNKEKFTLLDKNTFWLSETPGVAGSIGWDAAITRICSWVKLKNKSDGKIFFVFNTHFDHVGTVARKNSAVLIKKTAFTIADKAPVIIIGDFNSEPESEAYQTMTGDNPFLLYDSYHTAAKNAADTLCTFTGFEVNGKICKRIDYIFCDQNFSVSFYSSQHDNNGVSFPSDHLPVIADVDFKR